MSTHHLAHLLDQRGEYKGAEELRQRLLKEREKPFGGKNAHIVASIYCLTHNLYVQRKYLSAPPFYQRAIVSFRRIHSPSHQATVGCSEEYSSLLEKIKEEAARDSVSRKSDKEISSGRTSMLGRRAFRTTLCSRDISFGGAGCAESFLRRILIGLPIAAGLLLCDPHYQKRLKIWK